MKNYKELFTKELLIKEYSELHTITKMAVKYDTDPATISKYMKIHNINYNQYLQNKYQCNNIFTSHTEASFYIAGFIAADGNIYKNKNYNTYRIKITLSFKDLPHLNLIKSILTSNYPIHYYMDKFDNKSCELSIISKDIYESLYYFNITTNKTFSYKFPEHLISNKLINHFMRGYFDGDGGFSYLALGEKRTVKQLQTYLRGTEHFLSNFAIILDKQANISSENRVKKYDSTYSINYCGNKNTSRIANFLYKDATIYLQRKYDKIKHLLIVT